MRKVPWLCLCCCGAKFKFICLVVIAEDESFLCFSSLGRKVSYLSFFAKISVALVQFAHGMPLQMVDTTAVREYKVPGASHTSTALELLGGGLPLNILLLSIERRAPIWMMTEARGRPRGKSGRRCGDRFGARGRICRPGGRGCCVRYRCGRVACEAKSPIPASVACRTGRSLAQIECEEQWSGQGQHQSKRSLEFVKQYAEVQRIAGASLLCQASRSWSCIVQCAAGSSIMLCKKQKALQEMRKEVELGNVEDMADEVDEHMRKRIVEAGLAPSAEVLTLSPAEKALQLVQQRLPVAQMVTRKEAVSGGSALQEQSRAALQWQQLVVQSPLQW